MSARQRNSGRDSLKNFKSLGFSAQNRHRGHERARVLPFCRSVGMNSAQHYSLFFLFFFSAGIKGFLENCRKMLKIQDQFC
jgi:hypothetical protein